MLLQLPPRRGLAEKTMADTLEIRSPLDAEVIEWLTVGTRVLISGVIYTGRDAAHKRLVVALDGGEEPDQGAS